MTEADIADLAGKIARFYNTKLGLSYYERVLLQNELQSRGVTLLSPIPINPAPV